VLQSKVAQLEAKQKTQCMGQKMKELVYNFSFSCAIGRNYGEAIFDGSREWWNGCGRGDILGKDAPHQFS
jgi:hypothetical protein